MNDQIDLSYLINETLDEQINLSYTINDKFNNTLLINRLGNVFKTKLKSNLDELDLDDVDTYICNCLENSYKQVMFKSHNKYLKKKDDKFEVCSLCLNQIEFNTFKRVLPCGHTYHKKCIDKWLFNYNHFNCPNCRDQIYIESNKFTPEE
uniref:RING-type domain-containing protein n=1 Tax=viral metagenome TaxID=1070528 RepID=A0A6C0F635_9ZZZZ|tara:strand:- start:2122 stop:2571 length:450 start_codon:yes stop_codon:yes gene_type:complete